MPRPMPATARNGLAPPDEVSLLRAWQAARDRDALELLIFRHMPRLRSLARRGSPSTREDLVTEGVIALIDAAGRYPLDHPAPFVAFAMPAVRGAMLRARAGQTSVVSIPERQLRDAAAGRMIGPRAEAIQSALQPAAFDEIAPALLGPTSEEEALQRERQRQLRLAVAGALRPLERQERRLIVHHLLHEDRPLETLAGQLNLSLSRARSLEGRALHKMRNILMNKGFVMSDLT